MMLISKVKDGTGPDRICKSAYGLLTFDPLISNTPLPIVTVLIKDDKDPCTERILIRMLSDSLSVPPHSTAPGHHVL